MGYRSDVAYTIRFNSEEAYRLFILEAKADPERAGCFSNKDSFWDEAECDDDLWRIDFHAQGVKWYESYPDVQMHEKLLAQAREWAGGESEVANSRNVGYAFVRVGEDTEDCVEEHGGFADWDWLHVVRSIERN